MKKLLFLLLLLPLFFLPNLLSLSFVKPFVISWLEKKSQAHVEVGSLHFSWLGPQKIQDVTFEKNQIRIFFKSIESDSFFGFFSSPFTFTDGMISSSKAQIGPLQARIDETHFVVFSSGKVIAQGDVRSRFDFDAEFDIPQFPLAFFSSDLSKILGTFLDLHGSIFMHQEKGALDLTVRSSLLSTHIEAELSKEGIFLKKPLLASLFMSKELSRLVLKNINPLLITALSTEKPIAIEIDKEGFFLPLPLSLKETKIKKASLDFGKVLCQNGDVLSSLLFLIQKSGWKKETLTLWFSLASLSLEKGILNAQRVDTLIEPSLHICSWGTIDLLKDRLHMVLGIPQDTLEDVFKIKDLPPSFVFQLPLKGSTLSPKINTKKALSELAFLALKKVPLSKEAPPPPPLPWKSRLQ